MNEQNQLEQIQKKSFKERFREHPIACTAMGLLTAALMYITTDIVSYNLSRDDVVRTHRIEDIYLERDVKDTTNIVMSWRRSEAMRIDSIDSTLYHKEIYNTNEATLSDTARWDLINSYNDIIDPKSISVYHDVPCDKNHYANIGFTKQQKIRKIEFHLKPYQQLPVWYTLHLDHFTEYARFEKGRESFREEFYKSWECK